MESKYIFEQSKDGRGYLIYSKCGGRRPTFFGLREKNLGFHVYPADTETDKFNWQKKEFGLFEHHGLIKAVGEKLMTDWQGDIEKSLLITKDKKKAEWQQVKLKTWAATKTSKALAKKISLRLNELKQSCDPNVIAIQKAVFAICGKYISLVDREDFYKQADKYYLKDIVNYKSAAHTLIIADEDYNLRELIYENWRKFYAYDYTEIYTSLNKTLNNFPNRIPSFLLCQFNRVKLERPIYDRLELIFILNCVKHHNWARSGPEAQHIIQFAQNEEIKRARKKLEGHLRKKISFRKIQSVMEVSNFIMDMFYDEKVSRGNVCGLMDKSIDWHHVQARRQTRAGCSLSDDTPTAAPPIDLPNSKKIRFISTIGELLDEGMLMNHCIGSYYRQAHQGTSFFFHIEHAEEMASAQVDALTGRVYQCYGPYNGVNKASEYGRKFLEKWGLRLKENAKPKTDLVGEYRAAVLEDIPF